MEARLPFPILAAALCVSGCFSPRVLKAPLESTSNVRNPDFRQAAGSILGGTFVGGNRVTTLLNGDQIFPSMLNAIGGAKKTITFETFIFKKGEIPQKFASALSERARAGVQVRVILDAVGAKQSRTYHPEMAAAGVQIVRFHHLWRPDIRRYNNRTHRKLLIVDGKIGFIGGVGIAKEWEGNAQGPESWRDCHYRIEGPVVAQLQSTFAQNWLETKHELLFGPEYFPSIAPAGPVVAHVFSSAPRQGRYAVSLMYHMAIASARHSLFIENAYFVPNDEFLEALVAAARRGVRVKVILPGEHIDIPAVRRASQKRWGRLLEAGVEIYEYQPTMIHSKLLIVDGYFVSVGSANFDNRSLSLNDEANFDVLDSNFAAEQTRIFENDLRHSRKIPRHKPSGIPVLEKPIQAVQTPFEGQL